MVSQVSIQPNYIFAQFMILDVKLECLLYTRTIVSTIKRLSLTAKNGKMVREHVEKFGGIGYWG